LQGLWEGIYGPLLSPGKGLVLYAPILLLLPAGLWRFGKRDAGAALLVTATIAVCVFAHANTLVVWLGGWAWGPRFLVPIIAIGVLPLAELLEHGGRTQRLAMLVFGALGAIIQVPALLLDKGEYIAHLRDQQPGKCIWAAEDLYKWHPSYTPIFRQWGRLFDPSTYGAIGRYAATSTNIAAGRIVPKPHPWWSLLAAQGVSWPVLAAVVTALAVLFCILLVAAMRAAAAISAA
jgi:hypothetical protein